MGLSGGPDSWEKRLALLKTLNLPSHMSANALLEALNLLYTKETFEEEIGMRCAETSEVPLTRRCGPGG